MKKILMKTKTIGYWVLILAFCVIAATLAVSIFNIPGGYKFLVVETGSMSPVIPRMSVIMIQPKSSYHVGDVVTAKRPDLTTSLTHRLYKQDGTKFITKGDANNAPDSTEITKNEIMGKVLFSVPFLGYPVSFAKTQLGLIVLIVIPAILIIYSEFLNLKKETTQIFDKRKSSKTI